MHIILTDILICPRCGPEFGLVVLADEMTDRRIESGQLGCSNCRTFYPVQHGVPDLTGGSEAVEAAPRAAEDVEEAAYRAGALLGVGGGPSNLFLGGHDVAVAHRLAQILPDTLVVATAAEHGAQGPASLLRHGAMLPFRDRSLRGVALAGKAADRLLEEGLRTLLPAARLVLDPAPADALERLETAGAELLLNEESVMVACPGRRR